MENGKVCVISGASKGIGEACAREFAARGWRVYGLSRSGICPDGASGLRCDVTDEKQIANALADIRGREGRIDLIIANAGSGISGAAEFTESGDAHYQFEVNMGRQVVHVAPATQFQIDPSLPYFNLKSADPGWQLIEWGEKNVETTVYFE